MAEISWWTSIVEPEGITQLTVQSIVPHQVLSTSQHSSHELAKPNVLGELITRRVGHVRITIHIGAVVKLACQKHQHKTEEKQVSD